MSIFKRFGGKEDADVAGIDTDEISDELPPVNAVTRSPEDIARSIREQLDVKIDDSDDLEDLGANSAALQSESTHTDLLDDDVCLDLGTADMDMDTDDGFSTEDEWVGPYVDARGIPPVTPESLDPVTRSDAPVLEDIYAAETDIAPASYTATAKPSLKLEDPLEPMTEVDNLGVTAAPRTQGLNLSELRLDIVKITSDIDSGEALYRRAQQRVDSLIGFIEQAEVAVSTLSHMEPENRRLKAENHTLETDIEAQRYKLAKMESDLADQREISTKALIKVETLRAKLTDLNEALGESHREAEALTASNDELKILAERAKTNLDIETRENITMREKLTELSEHVENITRERLEAQKKSEQLARELDITKDRNNTFETENSQILLSFRNAERQNAQMRDELSEIQDKIVSFKTQHETHLHRRDDKIAALAGRNAELEKTLKHKENIIQSTIIDVSQLRKTNSRHDIEREKLEKIVEMQNYQLNKAEEELLQSKREMSQLDQRYKDVAQALSVKRRREQSGRNAAPDIQPQPPQPRRAPATGWTDKEANPFLTEDSA